MTQSLVETFYVEFVNLEEATDDPCATRVRKLPDGRFWVRTMGQRCEALNRNNRIYPTEVWAKHTIPECEFQQKVAARRVVGHAEHPESGRSQMPLGAVVITKVEPPRPTGEVMIEFETMSTPAGKIVESYIRDSVGFGVSSRGNGSVATRPDGASIVQLDFTPTTFDCVIDESTVGAEVAARRIREGVKQLQACAQTLLENAGGDIEKARQLDEVQVAEALSKDLGVDLEEYVVSGVSPYSGTMVTVSFESPKDAKTAKSALEDAQFYVSVIDEESIQVHTQYANPAMALLHVQRILRAKKLNSMEETVMGTKEVLEDIGKKLEAMAEAEDSTEKKGEVTEANIAESPMLKYKQKKYAAGSANVPFGDGIRKKMRAKKNEQDATGDTEIPSDADADMDTTPDAGSDSQPTEQFVTPDLNDPNAIMWGWNSKDLNVMTPPQESVPGSTGFRDVRVFFDECGNVVEVLEAKEVLERAESLEEFKTAGNRKAFFAHMFGPQSHKKTKHGQAAHTMKKWRDSVLKSNVPIPGHVRGGKQRKYSDFQFGTGSRVRARKLKPGKYVPGYEPKGGDHSEREKAIHAGKFRRHASNKQASSGNYGKETNFKGIRWQKEPLGGEAGTSKGRKRASWRDIYRQARVQGFKRREAMKAKFSKGKEKEESYAPDWELTANAIMEVFSDQNPSADDVILAARDAVLMEDKWPEEVSYCIACAMREWAEGSNDSLAGFVSELSEAVLSDYEPISEEESDNAEEKLVESDDGEDDAQEEGDIQESDETEEAEVPPEDTDVGRISFLESELARLENREEQYKGIIEGLKGELDKARFEHRLDVICLRHPVLERVRERLSQCDDEEDLISEAKSYLSFVGNNGGSSVEESKEDHQPASGCGYRNCMDSSAQLSGTPGEPLEEGAFSKPLTGGVAPQSTFSLLAKYRRRRRESEPGE